MTHTVATMRAAPDVDHHRWHGRLMGWAAWAGTDRGPSGYRRPGVPEHRVSYSEADAMQVDALLAQLLGRWPMAQHALKAYYLRRLWADDVVGYRALGGLMRRAWGARWRLSDGLRDEDRARRLVDRAVEALDAIERGD